ARDHDARERDRGAARACGPRPRAARRLGRRAAGRRRLARAGRARALGSPPVGVLTGRAPVAPGVVLERRRAQGDTSGAGASAGCASARWSSPRRRARIRAGAVARTQVSARMAAPVIADTYPIQELWAEKSNGWCAI